MVSKVLPSVAPLPSLGCWTSVPYFPPTSQGLAKCHSAACPGSGWCLLLVCFCTLTVCAPGVPRCRGLCELILGPPHPACDSPGRAACTSKCRLSSLLLMVGFHPLPGYESLAQNTQNILLQDNPDEKGRRSLLLHRPHTVVLK